jgi:hypothetical protein
MWHGMKSSFRSRSTYVFMWALRVVVFLFRCQRLVQIAFSWHVRHIGTGPETRKGLLNRKCKNVFMVDRDRKMLLLFVMT